MSPPNNDDHKMSTHAHILCQACSIGKSQRACGLLVTLDLNGKAVLRQDLFVAISFHVTAKQATGNSQAVRSVRSPRSVCARGTNPRW